MKGKIMIICYA
jgi:hypothetical protein